MIYSKTIFFLFFAFRIKLHHYIKNWKENKAKNFVIIINRVKAKKTVPCLPNKPYDFEQSIYPNRYIILKKLSKLENFDKIKCNKFTKGK